MFIKPALGCSCLRDVKWVSGPDSGYETPKSWGPGPHGCLLVRLVGEIFTCSCEMFKEIRGFIDSEGNKHFKITYKRQ